MMCLQRMLDGTHIWCQAGTAGFIGYWISPIVRSQSFNVLSFR
jgi:hypothetical protein